MPSPKFLRTRLIAAAAAAILATAAGDDGCDGAGQKVDFAKIRADRLRTGDPRLSLEERYTSHEGYVSAVSDANRLRRARLLLDEDVRRSVERAAASGVGK